MSEPWHHQTIDDYISVECDAGDCDEATSAVVLTDDHGWLPMCRAHAQEELGGSSARVVERELDTPESHQAYLDAWGAKP